MENLFKLKTPKRVQVTISSKSLRALFVNCDVNYIKANCKGSCCFNSKGILNVAIVPREELYMKSLGMKIKQGYLQPKQSEKRCPFQRANGLCKIHKRKPIGCAISPFNLTVNSVVIVRYRNLCMNCHKNGTIYAYKVFRKSLEAMFGKKETRCICNHLDYGGNDIRVAMFGDIYEDLMLNRKIRAKKI
jgi:Fe-S-cluster containining protein